MFEPLRCPECPWKSKPKHKRPQQALTQHRHRRHGNGAIAQVAAPTLPAEGFLVTFASGEQEHVPAEEHQQTMDRHWFFRGGALKQSFKRNDVTAVEEM